jgi:hypothetical protein
MNRPEVAAGRASGRYRHVDAFVTRYVADHNRGIRPHRVHGYVAVTELIDPLWPRQLPSDAHRFAAVATIPAVATALLGISPTALTPVRGHGGELILAILHGPHWSLVLLPVRSAAIAVVFLDETSDRTAIYGYPGDERITAWLDFTRTAITAARRDITAIR